MLDLHVFILSSAGAASLNLVQIFLEAVRAMSMNRLRAGLTMQGVIIGVGAVVLMLAIGESMREDINRRIAAMYVCNFCPRQLSSAFVAVPSVLHLRTAVARSSPGFRRCR